MLQKMQILGLDITINYYLHNTITFSSTKIYRRGLLRPSLRQIWQYKLLLLLFSHVRRVWKLACFQIFPQAVGWGSSGKVETKSKTTSNELVSTLFLTHMTFLRYNWRVAHVANQTTEFEGVQSKLQSILNYRSDNKWLETELSVKKYKI